MDLTAWWNSLDSLLRFLYAIAVTASAVLVIQIVLILVGFSHAGAPDAGDMGNAHLSDLHHGGLDLGGAHHAGLDAGSLHHGDFLSGDALNGSTGGHDFAPGHPDGSEPSAHGDMGELRLLSISGIVSFLTVFGWSSIILYQGGVASPLAIIIGLSLGYGAMYGAAKIVQLTVRLAEDGTMRLENALGQTALVYIPIPAAGGGEGKVTLTLQEQFVELGAVTDEGEAIPYGARVTVVGMRKGALVVKRTATGAGGR